MPTALDGKSKNEQNLKMVREISPWSSLTRYHTIRARRKAYKIRRATKQQLAVVRSKMKIENELERKRMRVVVLLTAITSTAIALWIYFRLLP